MNILKNASLIGFFLCATLVSIAHARNLPNTPECRKYMNYARSSGASGTYRPLVNLYNACLRSAKKQPRVRKLKCARGTYTHWYNGRRRCLSRKQARQKRLPDIRVGENGKKYSYRRSVACCLSQWRAFCKSGKLEYCKKHDGCQHWASRGLNWCK